MGLFEMNFVPNYANLLPNNVNRATTKLATKYERLFNTFGVCRWWYVLTLRTITVSGQLKKKTQTNKSSKKFDCKNSLQKNILQKKIF